MIFGMWDENLFSLGPIPVHHIVVTQWAIIVLVGVIGYMATRDMQLIPKGLQNAFEMLVVWTQEFFTSLMDKEHIAKMYAPLLSTFFIFILVCNYSGLIPGAAHIEGFQPPTSNWNVTVTLAVITAITVQFAGFKEHGGHYFKHFVSPSPLMLPMNLLEEITHPLSLTLRLFGNVFGEEMVVAFITFLVPFFIPSLIMALGVLLGAIQALVFTILSASYIAAATGEGH